MKRLSVVFAASFGVLSSAFAGDINSYAGVYTGQTSRGNPAKLIIPKKGLPTYRFMGQDVIVDSVTVSGKTIRINVSNGDGSIVLTDNGKGRMDMKYRFKAGRAAAVLTRE
jgi:hypothetical protein